MTEYSEVWGPESLEQRQRELVNYQVENLGLRKRWVSSNEFFYNSIASFMSFIVEPDKSVLCVRSENGSLLRAARAKRGVGLELSQAMIDWAKEDAPQFCYEVCAIEDYDGQEKFDYVIFNWVSETVDVQLALKNLRRVCAPHTRLIIYTYNHLWELPVRIAEGLGLKERRPDQNWFTEESLKMLLALTEFEWLRTHRLILLPKNVPFLSRFLNEFVGRLPIIERLGLVNVIVARPAPARISAHEVGVSVVIPCRNEAGNIRPAVERIPNLGRHTEIIFCDDKSEDSTLAEIKQCQQEFPEKDIKLVFGPGICKSKNVWAGFDAATQDILLILDADLTVMPEELPNFVDAILSGQGELINGTRLVYPVPRQAMRLFNMFGNKVFSVLFGYVLKQKISDTLCGTKVIWRKDWQRLKPLIGSWGIEDRWGDYELLFGAAKLNLRIVDLPVHYQERIFGQSKMVRVIQNGVIMLKMIFFAFVKLRLRM